MIVNSTGAVPFPECVKEKALALNKFDLLLKIGKCCLNYFFSVTNFIIANKMFTITNKMFGPNKPCFRPN